jgi:glycosyltransferase involved in cell wall biosynthesis
MAKMSTVSVLVPTYNNAHFLDETIQSVLNQTFGDFELIIVDNQSTDNTDAVVAPYLQDPRVKYYKNDTNIGMVGNWNQCLAYAQGTYIKFLCSDDKFHPQLLEKFVAVMEAHPQVAIVSSYREYFGQQRFKPELPPFSGLRAGKEVIYLSLEKWNWIGEPTTVMFRRSGLRVGNFKTDYRYFPDWDMWLRLLTTGDCYMIPETLSYFRLHANQETALVMQNSSNLFEEYYFFKAAKEKNEYHLNFQEFDIDGMIKLKAAKCARAIYKLIPKLNERKNWSLLLQAINIAVSEKAIFKVNITPHDQLMAKSLGSRVMVNQ